MNKYYYGHQKTKSNILTESRPRLLSEDIRSTYFLLMGTLSVMLIVCVLGYLYVSSQKAAKGYLLKELQNNYEELTAEARDLDTKLLDAQSLTNLAEESQIENMEDPSENLSFMGNENDYALKNP